MDISDELKQYTQSLQIPVSVLNLITQANFDLYYGPVVDDPEYPGFSNAMEKIREKLNEVDDIYVDTFAGGYSTSEPEAFEDEDGTIIAPNFEDFVHVSRNEMLTHILGQKLATYM